jgi:hypothetical protein
MVTRDSGLKIAFAEVSKEFGIAAQGSNRKNGDIPHELEQSKYEALLLDFDTVQQTAAILASVRQSPVNKNAVIFAVVGSADARQRAKDEGATFFLERPLQGDGMRRVLQAAYGLMTRERRRYFRCAADAAVELVRSSGEKVSCNTLNVSSNGMGVKSPISFDLGEKLGISLALPGVDALIRASGTVVWDDKHGKTGFSMECSNSQMQRELDCWLDSQFNRAVGKAN